ncbi:MAG: hypothetical protein CVT90_02545, partial [Candidatus Altiarchaeales archaeon HGW-Altiarchaeales-3]
IKDWDDSCAIEFFGKLVVSTDGPYKKRLVMKSALIHAATDVIVKGAKPLFALDTLIGTMDEIKEMVQSLKKQAISMNIPILGGNTMIEDIEPRCSITVIGKLIIDKPIRDSGAKKDDLLVLIGEPIWGDSDERIKKAKKLFKTWFEILTDKNEIKINAGKDVTKGGLTSCIYEISTKSGIEFKLNSDSLPYSKTRNLDNFLISVTEENYNKILDICKKNNCEINIIGKTQ